MAVQKRPGSRIRDKAGVKPAEQSSSPVAPVSETRNGNPQPPKTDSAPALRRVTATPVPAPAARRTEPVIAEAAIRAKAHELWKARGCRDGFAAQDWADAVAILKTEATKKAATRY